MAENKANALIGSLSTPDPDPGQTFTYSIISGGKGLQVRYIPEYMYVHFTCIIPPPHRVVIQL